MSLGLAYLALRRALPPGFVVTALVLTAAFLATTWRPDPLEAEALAGSIEPVTAASALARQGLWTALLVTLSPFLVARAAATLPGWRRGEVDWLFASACSRAGLVASTFLGLLAAAGVLVLLGAAAAELAAGPAGEGRALAARFATPTRLVQADQPLVVRVDPGTVAPGSALRVQLVLVGGGSGADLRLAVRSAQEEGPTRDVRTRLTGAGRVEVTLPAGDGPVELVLERAGGEALVALQRDGIELVTPTASARVASLRLMLRAWLALIAALALALGAGAWLSAPTAVLGALTLGFTALLIEGPVARLLPISSLSEALALAGEGLAAPWPSVRAIAVTAAAVLFGLVLATVGLRCWRRAP